MFNKTITNSSKFLKMPVSSRLLYYDLGMNADDDGYTEHFTVMRMTGASQQDLGILEINGLVKVFDENVLIITNWKENNYIAKDRYTPSKYLTVYNVDTVCIQNVNTGKVSIDKNIDRKIDNINNYISTEIEKINLTQIQTDKYNLVFKKTNVYINNIGSIPDDIYQQIKLYQKVISEIIDSNQYNILEKINYDLLEKTYGQIIKIDNVDNIVNYFKTSLINEIIKRGDYLG